MQIILNDDTLTCRHMLSTSIQDLSVIQKASECNEEENDRFRIFLKQQDSRQVDDMIHDLNGIISAQIDCTQCGNCCRSLMINVEPEEAKNLAAYLNVPAAEFQQAFIEESEQGQMVINTIPCHFLSHNKCSIYSQRFSECREFPHLHKPAFTSRLFGTFMHYGRCPIIFNVIEALKIELLFKHVENTVVE